MRQQPRVICSVYNNMKPFMYSVSSSYLTLDKKPPYSKTETQRPTK